MNYAGYVKIIMHDINWKQWHVMNIIVILYGLYRPYYSITYYNYLDILIYMTYFILHINFGS